MQNCEKNTSGSRKQTYKYCNVDIHVLFAVFSHFGNIFANNSHVNLQDISERHLKITIKLTGII